MPRPVAVLVLVVAWFLGFAFLGMAWGQTDPGTAAMAVPTPGGPVALNVGDLTFPGAVFLGFWMLARALPVALRSWTPTLRVELVHREREGSNGER
ncbi:MAG: hypothetical protein ABIO70_25760 [Pseudomonadota bacterium]